MDLTSLSNHEVSMFLAARIRADRLRQGYSQASLAKEAGIPVRTYKRIELTGDGSIENLILILRTLGRIRAVEVMFPSPSNKTHVSVVERMKLLAMTIQKNRFK